MLFGLENNEYHMSIVFFKAFAKQSEDNELLGNEFHFSFKFKNWCLISSLTIMHCNSSGMQYLFKTQRWWLTVIF